MENKTEIDFNSKEELLLLSYTMICICIILCCMQVMYHYIKGHTYKLIQNIEEIDEPPKYDEI